MNDNRYDVEDKSDSGDSVPKDTVAKDRLPDDLQRLQSLFSQEVLPLPNTALDKQIIAAAHREIKAPQKPVIYAISWWRKLSLPLYVAAGFTFTVLAYKSLWQVPVYQMEAESSHAMSAEFDIDSINLQQDMQQSDRIKRQLPELLVPPDSPERTENEKIVSDFEQNISADFKTSIEKDDIYTGTYLSKALYPEKEAWARKIIDHMRKGDIETARSELIRFKKIYPDYPIEEQIKVLTH